MVNYTFKCQIEQRYFRLGEVKKHAAVGFWPLILPSALKENLLGY